ncbi:tigger transposable element-derived protein 1-like [Photinus pyralis]|uniref:tigger transposable element-derived protein 1-like n=1 Tax=Photinus pyralis TaxID=7054 RepID=UPI001267776C|nr:tigger transposable element-derived protein 1-like [Photinus pyralis]XP_031342967.1 tigger transposable element-derived protein 1-like [Photinus pyralis]
MPTFYKRKRTSSRGSWSVEQLQNAVNAVHNGQTLNQAARTFGVPWSTLKRRIQKGDMTKKPMGPMSVLGKTNEKKIVRHIMKMQKFGFSPTRNEVRSIAFKLAEQLKLRHTFNKENEMAGLDWLHLFMSRNPELSIRKSEGISLARSRNMNKTNVLKYFDLLQDILVDNGLVNKPSNIYNMDESGLQLNNKPGYVVAAKGSKSVTNVTSGEKGETISVIACCNGEGTFLPPACVFKGKNEKPEYRDNMPPGSTIYMSVKSAYVTTDIFFLWLKDHFLPRKPDGPVLLILDGHSSHCSSVETLEFAETHDIILLCLPSHTTHYLQPLDRAFFKALKTYYSNACNSYMKMNPGRKISRLIFGKLLSDAWVLAATANNAISGFRATGIVPFNPHAIPDYAYLTTSEPGEAGLLQTSPERDDIPLPGTSNSTNDARNFSESQSSSSIVLETEPFANENVTPGKLLDAISPVPVIAQVEKVRKNSRNLAEILNSGSNIQTLKDKMQKKKEKEAKSSMKIQKENKDPKITGKKTKGLAIKGKSKLRSTVSSSDTESESSVELQLNDSDDDHNEDETCCVGCDEEYSKTKKPVDWIQCLKCERWFHEDCTKYGDLCDTCGKVKLRKV